MSKSDATQKVNEAQATIDRLVSERGEVERLIRELESRAGSVDLSGGAMAARRRRQAAKLYARRSSRATTRQNSPTRWADRARGGFVAWRVPWRVWCVPSDNGGHSRRIERTTGGGGVIGR